MEGDSTPQSAVGQAKKRRSTESLTQSAPVYLEDPKVRGRELTGLEKIAQIHDKESPSPQTSVALDDKHYRDIENACEPPPPTPHLNNPHKHQPLSAAAIFSRPQKSGSSSLYLFSIGYGGSVPRLHGADCVFQLVVGGASHGLPANKSLEE